MHQLATDTMQPIRRVADGGGYLVHWSGGLQAAEQLQNRWVILPVLHNGGPHANGYFTKEGLQLFLRERGLRFVALEETNWTNGEFNGHWAPVVPGHTGGQIPGPADLWSNIARNLDLRRMAPYLADKNISAEELERVSDAQEPPERLARSISLSLRNLDRSVQEISQYYHEELVNGLSAQRTDGLRYASTRDQGLYARVHSFFLHLGSARDYLASFVALQLGLNPAKTDSMARLVDELRGEDPGGAKSAPLGLLISNGYVEPLGAPSTKWKLAGWLAEVTDLRNEFVHRRTYGHTSAEKTGRLVPIDEANGIYRYFRPISWGNGTPDVYDVIAFHYAKLSALLMTSAQSSGHDTAMMTLTDDNVISSEVTVET